MIRGVAFDLEGTLVDVERVHHEGHVRAAADVGVRVSVEEATRAFPHFVGGPDAEIAREIWEVSDGRSTPERILAATRGYYKERIAHERVEARFGALEFVAAATRRGFRVAIGSATPTDQAMHLICAAGIDRVIPWSHVVLAEDVRRLKPHPDVYLETARRMGVRPEEQVVFDDSPNGVLAACRAGSVVVGAVVPPRDGRRLLDAGASCVFEDWRELSC